MARHYYEDSEIVFRRRKGWVELDDEFIQFYRNARRALLHLKYHGSRNLLDFVFFKVGENGIFYSGRLLLDEFNSMLKEEGVPAVVQRTMEKYLQDLCRCKCIIKMHKGAYHLNPHFFWMDNKKHRKDLLIEIDKTDRRSDYMLPVSKIPVVEEPAMVVRLANRLREDVQGMTL